MKKIIIAVLLCSFLASADEATDKAREAAFEKFRNYAEEQRLETAKEVKEHEGRNADGIWMFSLYRDHIKSDKEVSDEDVRRIWEIYEREDSERLHEDPVEEKLYAFSLITEFEDISKWHEEFDSIALNENPLFTITAINLFLSKIDRGTEREKIMLSNKTAIIKHLASYAEANKGKSGVRRDAEKINEIAKQYEGVPIPDVDEPREKGSPDGDRRIDHEVEAIWQDNGKDEILRIAGICGAILVVAFLIRWRLRMRDA